MKLRITLAITSALFLLAIFGAAVAEAGGKVFNGGKVF